MTHRVSRRLAVSSLALLALLAGHDASHVLDDGLDTKPGALALVAVPQWIVLAVVAAVILRAERARGALAALLLGAGTTVGFVAIHLLPFAPASYSDLDPSPVSWLLVWAPALFGLIVSALAWVEWRSAARETPGARRVSAA